MQNNVFITKILNHFSQVIYRSLKYFYTIVHSANIGFNFAKILIKVIK